MKRVLVLALVLIAGAWVYEQQTGKSLGVGAAANWMSGSFAGGYGMATSAGQSIGSGAARLGGSIGANMGAAIGN